MGTEILQPQDILIERLRFNPPSISPRRKNNNPHRKRSPPPPSSQSQPLISKKSTADTKQAKNLALGKVTILKRGECLDLKTKEENLKKFFPGNNNLKKTYSADLQGSKKDYDVNHLKKTLSGGDLILCGSARLGPDPALVPVRLNDFKQVSIRSDHVYAGSAFDLSPSPRKLPVPKFIKAVDDSATKDLRRLLRLE